jgi:DNA-directed RNA polymerase specialized sigma24 family protein
LKRLKRVFDRDAAYAALARYGESARSAEVEKNPVRREVLDAASKVDLDAAYMAIDEVVTIALKGTFSRCPKPDMLDDLHQAARLRLYRTLPKFADICDNSEFYFRLAYSVSKRAMLNEYVRLCRQSRLEVPITSGEVEDEDIGYEVVEAMEGWVVQADKNIASSEVALLADQMTRETYERVKEYLVESLPVKDRDAAVFVLLCRLAGRTPSGAYMDKEFGVDDTKSLVEYVGLALDKVMRGK